MVKKNRPQIAIHTSYNGYMRSKTNMKNSLTIAILSLSLSACEVPVSVPVTVTPPDAAADTATVNKAPAIEKARIADPVQADPVVAAPIVSPYPSSLTYYTLTQTENAAGPQFLIPVKGSCVHWDNDTYCWDDGLQAKLGLNYAFTPAHPLTMTYTFWGVQASGLNCFGDCSADYMPQSNPALMTADFETHLQFQMGRVSDVFNFGAAKTVSCTHHDSKLDCGDFSIPLSN